MGARSLSVWTWNNISLPFGGGLFADSTAIHTWKKAVEKVVPNFPIEHRTLVLEIIREIRNRMKTYGELTWPAYGATMDRVYSNLYNDVWFSKKLAILDELYGESGVKSLIYGVKRCKSEEWRMKCFEKHYKTIRKIVPKNDIIVHNTQTQIEETFDAAWHNVPSAMETSYYTESWNLIPLRWDEVVAHNAAYGLVHGEIVTPDDVPSKMYRDENE